MDYKKILVPFDGSKHALRAVKAATGLIRGSEGTTMIILNVVSMSVAPTISESDPVLGSTPTYIDYKDYENLYDDSLIKRRDKMIKDVTGEYPDLPKNQIEFDTIAHPSPVQGIIEYCETHNCDLIVMGRRGLGAIRGAFGSVSSGILRSTDLPVLTVK